MDLSDSVIHLLDGVIGAAVGSMATIYATRMVIREEGKKEQRHEERELHSLLDAIGVEISTLWNFHMKRVGNLIEKLKDGEALEFYYPLTQDYFTVYHTNADKIGRVRNSSLREAIVVCYNKCKKVVDGFKYNNDLYVDYREMADQMASMQPGDIQRESVIKPLLNTKYNALKEYAHVIKEDHFELKGYVDELMKKLESRQAH